MLRSVVCDAGGILVVSGALVGSQPPDIEVLALDATSLLVGRFLMAHHHANAERARVEIGIALSGVHEWFPVRTLVADTLNRAGDEAVDSLDSWSALLLAEQLNVALFTASDELASERVQIIRPW